jgi:hypothetical protein
MEKVDLVTARRRLRAIRRRRLRARLACSSFDTARFQQGWAAGYAHRNGT